MTEELTGAAEREREAIELTRSLVHKHYCENDLLADETLFDEPFFWLDAAEQEFDVDRKRILNAFHQFKGQVPKCNVTDEEYYAKIIAPNVCLVAGRMWISTDPATHIYLQVHQRITTCVRWTQGRARCCLLHISNPYTEMLSGDVGFPTQMAQQSREYVQQQLEKQKQIAAAGAELSSIYHTVSCGILRLRRKEGKYQLLIFNRTLADMMGRTDEEIRQMDWSQGVAPELMPEDAALAREKLACLHEPGDHSTFDCRLRSREGRTLHFSCSNELISRDEEGEIIQRMIYDITPRVELEATLKRMSFVDSLTGLFNRNRFNQEAAAIQRGSEGVLGVACFDLNGLKAWNDKLGHLAGDELIRRAAAHIVSVFPGMTYRVGGDEFVVLDQGSSREEFQAAVERAKARLQEGQISIAVGLSWRAEGRDVWKQYDEADHLMYEEKKNYYKQNGRADLRGR